MITLIWGIEGSAKSSAGLTWPKPLFHMDLDLGGFDRAIWRIEQNHPELKILRLSAKDDVKSVDWSKWDIVTKPYIAPIQLEKMLGAEKIALNPKMPTVMTVRFPREIKGYRELWEQIIVDYVHVVQQPAVRTIMPDSATQIWTVCHQSLLQDKQEIQLANGIRTNEDKFREKLLPIEYPNEKMRSFIYTARSCGKDLVMTHYPKDVYATRTTATGTESYTTGEKTPDGFKDTVKLIDIGLWAYTELDKQKFTDPPVNKQLNPLYNKMQPHLRVDLKCGLSGMGMTAIGTELPSPDYDGLMMIQKIMKGEDL
jgi:hypothetical protein